MNESKYESSLPKAVPENGFYYHYKHDPVGAINQLAYEVIGVGHHTEDDCNPHDANMVIYRPLYEALIYKHGKLSNLRPLEMFMGSIEKDGHTFPRFSKITDPDTISSLETIKKEMYGD